MKDLLRINTDYYPYGPVSTKGYINLVLLVSGLEVFVYSIFINIADDDHIPDPIRGPTSCKRKYTLLKSWNVHTNYSYKLYNIIILYM